MKLEELKNLKYLYGLYEVQHKVTNKKEFVYIETVDDHLDIFFEESQELVPLNEYDDYIIIENMIDKVETICDFCLEDEATLVRDSSAVCKSCWTMFDFKRIDHSTFKFMSNAELQVLAKAHKARLYRDDVKIEKGIVIFIEDDDYDCVHVKVIDYNKIGPFE